MNVLAYNEESKKKLKLKRESIKENLLKPT